MTAPLLHLLGDMLKGKYVRFHARDVEVPYPSSVLDELHGSDVLEGRVVGLTDGGDEREVFVVVEVERVEEPLTAPQLSRQCVVDRKRLLGPPMSASTVRAQRWDKLP